MVLGVVFLASRLEDGPLAGPAFYAREPCVGTDAPNGAPFNFHYKGFPKSASARAVFQFIAFPRSNSMKVALLRLIEKMEDCETTIGHVGRYARTLMKDARRGLNR